MIQNKITYSKSLLKIKLKYTIYPMNEMNGKFNALLKQYPLRNYNIISQSIIILEVIFLLK
jgi:hypothetical protein